MWYSKLAELENQTGSTLTIDVDTNAGVYYFRRKVIRDWVDRKTQAYWSSVASVQINKAATGNAVTLIRTETTFNGEAHSLTQAMAVQDGSTSRGFLFKKSLANWYGLPDSK